MSHSPLVSVVIPAYNASRWIGEALESVLAQDFTDYEIIVVDDGSTDDTARVVETYRERVRCIRKPNGGVSSARNVGIRAGGGAYVAFLDADDLWTSDKLRLQLEVLTRNEVAWVYSDAWAFDGESGVVLHRLGKVVRQYDGDILEALFVKNCIPSPTPVIRRSVFEHIGCFDEAAKLSIGEDLCMWLKIAAEYPIALVPVPLAYYRVHATSTTGMRYPGVLLQGHLAVLEDAVARAPARLGPLRERAIANCYLHAGRASLGKGYLAEARRLLLHAMQYYPAIPAAVLLWASTLLGRGVIDMLLKTIRLRRRQGVIALGHK
jgi:hypothetical protein